MALRNQAFKVIGMWRDNSESSQDNKYAYENFNMRIEARDGNTQLSMENERGNERIDIIGNKIDQSYTDEQASISNGLLQIKGTPIGYCQIGDDILLFTTETERMSDEELQEYNEDPLYITNKRNVFTLSSAKIQSISISDTTTLKLYLSLIETSDWINFLDDLEIKLYFSTLKYTNAVRDQYEFSNYYATGVKTAEPIANGLLYDFTVNNAIDCDYIFIHSLEVRYNNSIAAIIDLRKLYSINDYKYEMLNSVTIFPSYTAQQTDFTDSFTQVGSYSSQDYKVSSINGSTSSSGNVISFTPNTDYAGIVNQVFTQDFNLSGNLIGLKSGGIVASVDDESITVPNNSKHSDIVVLRYTEEQEEPSSIEVQSLSCTPQSSIIPLQGTVTITVTHTPENAQCTATCIYPEQNIQLVSRNGNTFTFKLLNMGGSNEQNIQFSCEEKPSLNTVSTIRLGSTILVDTPLYFTFDSEGINELTIKIYSSQYTASDFSAYINERPLEMESESNPQVFYTAQGFQDVAGEGYNIQLKIYATPNNTNMSREGTLVFYLPGHIYFNSISLHQEAPWEHSS